MFCGALIRQQNIVSNQYAAFASHNLYFRCDFAYKPAGKTRFDSIFWCFGDSIKMDDELCVWACAWWLMTSPVHRTPHPRTIHNHNNNILIKFEHSANVHLHPSSQLWSNDKELSAPTHCTFSARVHDSHKHQPQFIYFQTDEEMSERNVYGYNNNKKSERASRSYLNYINDLDSVSLRDKTCIVYSLSLLLSSLRVRRSWAVLWCMQPANKYIHECVLTRLADTARRWKYNFARAKRQRRQRITNDGGCFHFTA